MAISLARQRGEQRAVSPVLVLVIAGALAVAVLGWVGVRAQQVLAARRIELRRAESTLQAFADLRRRYSPAVAAESIAWRRTWLQLQELGVVGDERLFVTQRVARAAESAGLRNVKVHIDDSDTTSIQPRLRTEGVRSNAAPFSLRVEGSGGLASVVAFLRELPPSVAPIGMSLQSQQGQNATHRISLAVYGLEFTNGVPDGWTSVERGNAGAGSGSRPDG